MAFNAANLSIKRDFSVGNERFFAWAYSTGDSAATASTGGYFSTPEAILRLRAGDLIAITASDGKVLLLVESTNTQPTVESVSFQKLASGITSFEYLA